MIEPVFEDLARSTTGSGGNAQAEGQIAFVKVDLGVGMGSTVAREYGVTATPTFGFFLDGKKVRAAQCLNCTWLRSSRAQIHELKGVNAPELRTQVDLLLYQAFPRRLISWLCQQRAMALMIFHSSPSRVIGPPIYFLSLDRAHLVHTSAGS
jgi:hypothetical protein